MCETRCVRIRLKAGSLDLVRAWAETMNRRKEEALQTLRDESVVVESVFLDRAPDGDFLVYYMRGQDLDRSATIAQRSAHAIDEVHRRFKQEAWESNRPLELLLDLDRTDEV